MRGGIATLGPLNLATLRYHPYSCPRGTGIAGIGLPARGPYGPS